jgi:hypothetical protein
MTAALDAMVAAMRAEIGRQASENMDYFAPSFGPPQAENEDGLGYSDGLDGYDGRLDLQKVARAGLAAIRVPDEAMKEASGADYDSRDNHMNDLLNAWHAMIGAILTDTP